MQIIKELYDSIYLNFYVFGSLLACVFTFTIGFFLITLKNRSKSTTRLATVFLILAGFNASYVFGSMFYHPLAAFHRWGTVGLILPVFIYYIQWIFYFPEDTEKNIRRKFFFVQWVILILAVAVFYIKTYNADVKYHFAGHYYDFDMEALSGRIAIIILAYAMLFLFVGLWKTYKIKEKERWAILKMTISVMIASFVPVILNRLSREGKMDRGDFMTSFVVFTVLGFFIVVLLYFENTHDKTTFMAIIVGISLVTFLLMMQGLGYFTMQDREEEYDRLYVQYTERILEDGHENPNLTIYIDPKKDVIKYIVELASYRAPEVNKKLYSQKDPNSDGLDFPLMQVDFQNSLVYEKILRASNENGPFINEATDIIEKTDKYFGGYREALLTFLEQDSSENTKAAFIKYMNKLNKDGFIFSSILANHHDDVFCKEFNKFFVKELDSKKNKHFANGIREHFVYDEVTNTCTWDNKEIDNEGIKEFRREIYKFFRYLKPAGERIFRKSVDGKTHFVTFSKFIPGKDGQEDSIKEVGYNYLSYREYMHLSAKEQFIILGVVLLVLLTLYPYFFYGSLVKPLNDLLLGVRKVNNGNLDIRVPIKTSDEIGFLTESFNGMVHSIQQARLELQDYANNLEEMVNERTRELQEKMEEVQRLKIQQDGDYFLTSLLTKPLFFNANRSTLVKTEFLIKQKKHFVFRNKEADLGGDVCISGNLKFGTPDNFKRYTMAMNGDAMGKSMQGAGGSLVMGVVMNSIMARSASNKRILDSTPEKWLTDVYFETNSVFKSFNGTMVLSATVLLIDDTTGKMFYWNAEHPFTVLYRDETASFIEPNLRLRKLGLESEYEFAVYDFQLEPGDVILLASDGRDDIDLTPGEPIRTINDDENLFLQIVEEGGADIDSMVKLIKSKGDITDDLSFVKVSFQEDRVGMGPLIETSLSDSAPITTTDSRNSDVIDKLNKLYQDSKKLYLSGEILAAKEKMEEAYSLDRNVPKLNKLYGLLCFKTKDYEKTIKLLGDYLTRESGEDDLYYYLSVAHKKLGNIQEALSSALKGFDVGPKNVSNIVNISDLFRMQGDKEQAKKYAETALTQDSQNKNAKKILSLLG